MWDVLAVLVFDIGPDLWRESMWGGGEKGRSGVVNVLARLVRCVFARA